MKEQSITEKESLDIITSMIESTKQRLHLGDGNILLLWGYLTVGVAMLITLLLLLTHNAVWNWLWFLIWIIGGIVTPHMMKKQQNKAGVRTYTDKLSNGIWSLVGANAILFTFLCLGFMLFAGKDIWSLMLVFALLVVGIVETVQGMIIKEKTLIAGGSIGMIAGVVTMALIVAAIPLYIGWFMPMFVVAWICMMIIPGHCLNAKARRQK